MLVWFDCSKGVLWQTPTMLNSHRLVFLCLDRSKSFGTVLPIKLGPLFLLFSHPLPCLKRVCSKSSWSPSRSLPPALHLFLLPVPSQWLFQSLEKKKHNMKQLHNLFNIIWFITQETSKFFSVIQIMWGRDRYRYNQGNEDT